jgi:hypothetical protein
MLTLIIMLFALESILFVLNWAEFVERRGKE